MNPPAGCVFHTRCPVAMDRCKQEVPSKLQVNDKHVVACNFI
ncbi:oligopeptide/dipeptide ABC transporter ATP-binding protein [Niallia sp. FSL W8-0177]